MVFKSVGSVLLLLLSPVWAAAQGGTSRADTSASSPIEVDYADVFENLRRGDSTIQVLEGNVELHQDSAYIYCDHARIRDENYVKARGNVSIRQNDTISIFADSLEYFADSMIAYLYGEVALVNGEQQLFTKFLRYDLQTKRARYNTRAKLTDGRAQLSSLRGTYDVERRYADFRDSVFVVGDDFNLLADTLGFNTETRTVYFEGPTLIATPESGVYCEDGYYNLGDTTGVFAQRAQVKRGTQRATADTIRYFGSEDLFELEGSASFIDEDQQAQGNRIVYDEAANTTTLAGDASFVQGEQRVRGQRIFYDGGTQTFRTAGGVHISEPPYLLDADSLWYDELSGVAKVEGHVLWQDTLGKRSIVAERVDYRRAGDYVKAYGDRPVFSVLVEGDSLFLSADTLLSFTEPSVAPARGDSPADQQSATDPNSGPVAGSTTNVEAAPRVGTPTNAGAPARSDDTPDSTLTQSDSTLLLVSASAPDSTSSVDSMAALEGLTSPDSVRRLLAYPRVKIYGTNLQAVCDSLAYSGEDSTFTLLGEPLLWSDTSQFSGDTIHIALRNSALHRVSLYSNALIVNSPDEVFFNQVKGRSVDAFFREGTVDYMNVLGNAESVYYLLDELRAYLGVNHVRSARMRLTFLDQELSDIYFYDQVDGDLAPLRAIGERPQLLEGFRWETERRPLSLNDLR